MAASRYSFLGAFLGVVMLWQGLGLPRAGGYFGYLPSGACEEPLPHFWIYYLDLTGRSCRQFWIPSPLAPQVKWNAKAAWPPCEGLNQNLDRCSYSEADRAITIEVSDERHSPASYYP